MAKPKDKKKQPGVMTSSNPSMRQLQKNLPRVASAVSATGDALNAAGNFVQQGVSQIANAPNQALKEAAQLSTRLPNLSDPIIDTPAMASSRREYVRTQGADAPSPGAGQERQAMLEQGVSQPGSVSPQVAQTPTAAPVIQSLNTPLQQMHQPVSNPYAMNMGNASGQDIVNGNPSFRGAVIKGRNGQNISISQDKIDGYLKSRDWRAPAFAGGDLTRQHQLRNENDSWFAQGNDPVGAVSRQNVANGERVMPDGLQEPPSVGYRQDPNEIYRDLLKSHPLTAKTKEGQAGLWQLAQRKTDEANQLNQTAADAFGGFTPGLHRIDTRQKLDPQAALDHEALQASFRGGGPEAIQAAADYKNKTDVNAINTQTAEYHQQVLEAQARKTYQDARRVEYQNQLIEDAMRTDPDKARSLIMAFKGGVMPKAQAPLKFTTKGTNAHGDPTETQTYLDRSTGKRYNSGGEIKPVMPNTSTQKQKNSPASGTPKLVTDRPQKAPYSQALVTAKKVIALNPAKREQVLAAMAKEYPGYSYKKDLAN